MPRDGSDGVPLDGVAVGDGSCGRELGDGGEGRPLVGEGGDGEVVGDGSDGRELGGEGEGSDRDEDGDGSDGEDEEGIGIWRGICRGVGRLTCAQLAASASHSTVQTHLAAQTAGVDFHAVVIAVSKPRVRFRPRLRAVPPRAGGPLRGSTNARPTRWDSKQTCA